MGDGAKGNRAIVGQTSKLSEAVTTGGAPPERVDGVVNVRKTRCTSQSGTAECEAVLSWKQPHANGDPIQGYRITALVTETAKSNNITALLPFPTHWYGLQVRSFQEVLPPLQQIRSQN